MLRISLLILTLCGASMALAQDPWDHRDHPNWDRSWNDRAYPRAGACFFTDSDFRGNRFCVRRGERLDRLPGSFGDNISSIQMFGGARVVVFNDRDFRGGSAEFGRSVRDLRNRRFRDGHTWNNRISSVIIR
jgi:hypothetical protein